MTIPHRLSIKEETFNSLYPDLVGHYNHFNDPVPAGLSRVEFEQRYLKLKLWRLNNIYSIIDKRGNKVRFVMNKSQHIVYARSRQHPRIIILKSRQQGISTFWLVSFEDDGLWSNNMTIGLMAQGMDEASTLLERAKFIWDELADDIKSYLSARLIADNSKKFAFANGSNIFIRVSFRSATLQRLHISEFGKIANANPKRAVETKTGTLQALAGGMTGVIESTAEGANMFKTMWDNSVEALASGQMTPKDFYPVFLSWLDDPDCVQPVDQLPTEASIKYFAGLVAEGLVLSREQQNFWIMQHRELGGGVHQEYPATANEAFVASRDGTYYSVAYNSLVVGRGRRVEGLWDSRLSVDLYFDLGVDDYTVVLAVQVTEDGDVRVVREYWNNGYALGHYLEEAASWGYAVRNVWLPHDAAQRNIATEGVGRAKSTEAIGKSWLRDAGLKWLVKVIPRGSVADGIEAVREMIPVLHVDVSCTYLHQCMNNYSKEWSDQLDVWKKTPLHNEYSHGADTLRQVAVKRVKSTVIGRARSQPVSMGLDL